MKTSTLQTLNRFSPEAIEELAHGKTSVKAARMTAWGMFDVASFIDHLYTKNYGEAVVDSAVSNHFWLTHYGLENNFAQLLGVVTQASNFRLVNGGELTAKNREFLKRSCSL